MREKRVIGLEDEQGDLPEAEGGEASESILQGCWECSKSAALSCCQFSQLIVE